MSQRWLLFVCALCLWSINASCASHEYVIPDSLAARIDTSLTFSELKESPASHVGKVVLLGGEVLKAKRLREGTLIEVLQLPIERGEPAMEEDDSQGRFLALRKDFLDPATLADRPRITVVGEVTGARTQRLDDTDYTYPLLDIKDLKVWQDPGFYGVRPGPRFGVSIGGGTGIGTGAGGGIGFGF